MSRSAARVSQHSRMFTEPNQLSKSFADYKVPKEDSQGPVTETTSGSCNLPPYMPDHLPQFRVEERLRFPAEGSESPSRYSAQRDFKTASEKLDALTRKLSIIHRSLVGGGNVTAETTNCCPTSSNDIASSTPVSKSHLQTPSHNDLEIRLMHMEGKVKELHDFLVKSIAELRDDNTLQSSFAQTIANMDGRMIDLEAAIFNRLNAMESKNWDYLETKMTNCESKVLQLEARMCTIESRQSTSSVTYNSRINNIEDECSVQNQRIDALRRDVDKIVESQALLIKTLSSELRQLRG